MSLPSYACRDEIPYTADPDGGPTKIPLLLFSGGADSTMRLLTLLESGRNVDVVSINAGVGDKAICEAGARVAIVKHIADRGVKGKVQSNDSFHEAHQLFNDRMKFSQLPAWIVGALHRYWPGRHSHVELCYVMGDDICPYLDEITRAWHSLTRVLYERPAEIRFPLMWTRKKDIYLRLFQAGLLDLIWVCERPLKNSSIDDAEHGYRECRYCDACRRAIATRQELRDAGYAIPEHGGVWRFGHLLDRPSREAQSNQDISVSEGDGENTEHSHPATG